MSDKKGTSYPVTLDTSPNARVKSLKYRVVLTKNINITPINRNLSAVKRLLATLDAMMAYREAHRPWYIKLWRKIK